MAPTLRLDRAQPERDRRQMRRRLAPRAQEVAGEQAAEAGVVGEWIELVPGDEGAGCGEHRGERVRVLDKLLVNY